MRRGPHGAGRGGAERGKERRGVRRAVLTVLKDKVHGRLRGARQDSGARRARVSVGEEGGPGAAQARGAGARRRRDAQARRRARRRRDARTLSVSTSPITSPDESLSPSFLVQRAILPAVIVGLSAGIVTTDDAARASSGRAADEAASERRDNISRADPLL